MYAKLLTRPMKHHALFGLILGLVAAARIWGAEPPSVLTSPVLFTVEFNNATKLVTVTGTGATATTTALPTGLTSYDGITLLNFFSTNSSQTWGDFGPEMGTSERTLEISILGATPSPRFLDPYAATSGISDPGSQLTDLGQNYNIGQNLALGSTDPGTAYGTGAVTFSFSGVVEFKYSGNREFTNNNDPSSPGFEGPLYVYAGANDANFGNAFLGTYTISVVPEPTTYAAIAGGLGLAAAVIHRRRQRAKAAQG